MLIVPARGAAAVRQNLVAKAAADFTIAGQAVSINVDTTGIEGDADPIRTAITTALTHRLGQANIAVSPGQAVTINARSIRNKATS